MEAIKHSHIPTHVHWPHLVGKAGDEAAKIIKAEVPQNYKVFIVQEGGMVTMDMNDERVRVFVNSQGMVSRPPRVG